MEEVLMNTGKKKTGRMGECGVGWNRRRLALG